MTWLDDFWRGERAHAYATGRLDERMSNCGTWVDPGRFALRARDVPVGTYQALYDAMISELEESHND